MHGSGVCAVSRLSTLTALVALVLHGPAAASRPSAIPSARPVLSAAGNGIESAGTAAVSMAVDDLSAADSLTARLMRVLTLRDYNTRVVLLGTTILGMAAGVVGTFMLLRKRSLVGDVVSHASLPGIVLTFIVLEMRAPGSGKSLPALSVGAAVSGLVGVLCASAIRRWTRIKDDAALAIVLSIFFGFGIALLTVAQKLAPGNAAGLDQFIFGRAASMTASDVTLIGQAAAVALCVSVLLFKEFSLLCFDEMYARAQGWPAGWLDILLMALVVAVTVVGQQSVGLLLVVAMLVIPPAAARFWTEHLGRMTVISILIGGLSAAMGVVLSAVIPRLAAGAIIVLSGTALFGISLLLGTRRGLIQRLQKQYQVKRRVDLHDLLRAAFEVVEQHLAASGEPLTIEAMTDERLTLEELLARRSWTAARVRRAAHIAQSGNLLVYSSATRRYRLTRAGAAEARRVARNHRLWEMFLIHHADIAPARVDRYADEVEHVLAPELVEQLRDLLERESPHLAVPESPHEESADK